MRNFLFIAIFLISISVYAVIHYSINNHHNNRVLRVGVECDYPPNNWEEERPTGSNVPLANKEGFYAEGYDIQIAKIVAKSIGAELEIKKLAWDDLIPALNRNEIDVIFSGMLDTAERRKLIDFTETYEETMTEYGVFVHKNGKWADAKNLTDFAGARFIAQKDTNLDSAINQLQGAVHLPPVDTVSNVFDTIVKNEADGTVVDIQFMNSCKKTYPELKGLKFPKDNGFVLNYSGICAGVRKNDTKLADEINNVLKKIPLHERQKIMDISILKSEG